MKSVMKAWYSARDAYDIDPEKFAEAVAGDVYRRQLLGGIWCLCLLCTRRYGRGAFGSLLRNARMIYLPVIGIMLTITGVLVYVKQPFLDHSCLLYTSMWEWLNWNIYLQKQL